jgi:hypothetical protein
MTKFPRSKTPADPRLIAGVPSLFPGQFRLPLMSRLGLGSAAMARRAGEGHGARRLSDGISRVTSASWLVTQQPGHAATKSTVIRRDPERDKHPLGHGAGVALRLREQRPCRAATSISCRAAIRPAGCPGCRRRSWRSGWTGRAAGRTGTTVSATAPETALLAPVGSAMAALLRPDLPRREKAMAKPPASQDRCQRTLGIAPGHRRSRASATRDGRPGYSRGAPYLATGLNQATAPYVTPMNDSQLTTIQLRRHLEHQYATAIALGKCAFRGGKYASFRNFHRPSSEAAFHPAPQRPHGAVDWS